MSKNSSSSQGENSGVAVARTEGSYLLWAAVIGLISSLIGGFISGYFSRETIAIQDDIARRETCFAAIEEMVKNDPMGVLVTNVSYEPVDLFFAIAKTNCEAGTVESVQAEVRSLEATYPSLSEAITSGSVDVQFFYDEGVFLELKPGDAGSDFPELEGAFDEAISIAP